MEGKKVKMALVISMILVALSFTTVYAPSNVAAKDEPVERAPLDSYDPEEEENATALKDSIRNVVELAIWLSPAITALLFIVCLGMMQYKKAVDKEAEEAAAWKKRAIEVLAIGVIISISVIIVGAFYGAV